MNRLFSAIAVALVCLFTLCACPESRTEGPDDLAEARAALGKRNFLEAEKSFERYLRRVPDGSERWYVWNNLVDIALNVRADRKASIELLEAMLLEYGAAAEKRRSVRMRLAEQYRLSRKYERAVTLWSAVAADGDAPGAERADAYRNLAEIYLRRLEFELATEALGSCLALHIPESARAQCLYDLAQTYMGMEDPDGAISQLRAVLLLKDIPESLRLLTTFMLADALDQQNKDAEARVLFESIRADYPNPVVVEKRIDALRGKKKPGAAVAAPAPSGTPGAKRQ